MTESSENNVRRPAGPWWLTAAEVVTVFGVFFIQGAWPVPDVNEPYYLGKAIDYWNPDWIPNDPFLDSADTHKVFYFAFGWLSMWLAPFWLAWVGRVLTWGLLAWAWRRMSFAFLPRPWLSVVTAALFVCLLDRYHLAGEWVVGGVEAKGFAFVLVFLGLEALMRDRWNRAWLLLGAASAFHVLVGGWSVVAAGIAWLLARPERPRLRSMLPALAGGFVLSLPGLLPSVTLDWGVDRATVARAREIYVFERLPHHLDPMQFPQSYVERFLLLCVVLLLLERIAPLDGPRRRLRGFVAGALALAGVGVAAGAVQYVSRSLAADLLRFYWFRLSDVAVPLGVSLVGVRCLAHGLETGRRGARWAWAAALGVAVLHVGGAAARCAMPAVPRSDRLHNFALESHRVLDYLAWRRACEWIAESGAIPAGARFITPRMGQSFKWYAGRSEVATWKDIPQDARSIVVWRETLDAIYASRTASGRLVWQDSPAALGVARLRWAGRRYEADYVLTLRWPVLDLPVVHENDLYAVYRLDAEPEGAAE